MPVRRAAELRAAPSSPLHERHEFGAHVSHIARKGEVPSRQAILAIAGLAIGCPWLQGGPRCAPDSASLFGATAARRWGRHRQLCCCSFGCAAVGSTVMPGPLARGPLRCRRRGRRWRRRLATRQGAAGPPGDANPTTLTAAAGAGAGTRRRRRGTSGACRHRDCQWLRCSSGWSLGSLRMRLLGWQLRHSTRCWRFGRNHSRSRRLGGGRHRAALPDPKLRVELERNGAGPHALRLELVEKGQACQRACARQRNVRLPCLEHAAEGHGHRVERRALALVDRHCKCQPKRDLFAERACSGRWLH